MVKLSKLNGVKKTGDEGERREMITPSLREALTKQGEKKEDWFKRNVQIREFTQTTAI